MTNNIKIHNQHEFQCMREAGALAARCLDLITDYSNKFDIVLFNKKQEFLGGTLKLSNLVCDSKYIVGKNSHFQNNEL